MAEAKSQGGLLTGLMGGILGGGIQVVDLTMTLLR